MAKKYHELTSVDTDILQLRKALNDLEDHRQDILSDFKELESTISPHRDMPREILERIFRFCDSPPINLPPRFTRPQNIWAILQVCSRWREIAIADPILWGLIEIKRSWANLKGALRALDDLVHDVFINRGSQGKVEYRTHVADNAGWENVLIFMRTYPTRLQKIGIEFTRDYQVDDVLLYAPSTCVRAGVEATQLDRPPSIDSALQIYNTWNHITHIMIDSITILGLCHILCHCNQLADLKVIFKNSDMLYSAPHDLIKLGLLESVVIKQDNNVIINEFLDTLISEIPPLRIPNTLATRVFAGPSRAVGMYT
ncbi:hypothetical protein BDZ94DRAFT_1323230 [Collybia nuda]|uniref:F-box domain-containing protein n=1 Tax=Collybia nuda TaxID=64659 RepID=A0A9P5Y2U8_9AGAR|nr:hypothetical protein BDZ94DRAFT_1323230 [Collybia nuda]